jgi:hypothetical protein
MGRYCPLHLGDSGIESSPGAEPRGGCSRDAGKHTRWGYVARANCGRLANHSHRVNFVDHSFYKVRQVIRRKF